MDLKQINKILKDLEKIRRGKPLSIDVINKVNGKYSSQGEEGLSYEVYEIEGFYVKLTITTDSYGDDESIQGVEFVQPQQKTITVYETI